MNPEPNIRVNVDPTNPGQFFACCGLLELADRLWPGAEGWFEPGVFCIACEGNQEKLIQALATATFLAVDPEDKTATRVDVQGIGSGLRLDWWQDEIAGGKELKVWAGTMESHRIAVSLQSVLSQESFHRDDFLNAGMIVYDEEKKVEPYYFDARRCPNAHSRDVGFAPNELGLTTTAFPAVELLCLIGLQRALPLKHDRRIYDYFLWSSPIPAAILPAAVTGCLPGVNTQGYRFETWYRTGQKKHKAFRSATAITKGSSHE